MGIIQLVYYELIITIRITIQYLILEYNLVRKDGDGQTAKGFFNGDVSNVSNSILYGFE